VARCGLLFATLKGKTMKKMFVLFCMLFSCAFSLAAVNINAASLQELEALPGIGPAVLAKLKDQASVGAPAPKGPAKPAIPAAKK
ncbi:ComEA family DNA-binding protein, partial [Neisseria meningitidis]